MCILVCRQGIAGLMDNSNDQKHNDTSPKGPLLRKTLSSNLCLTLNNSMIQDDVYTVE